jgi:hypothetical protein
VFSLAGRLTMLREGQHATVVHLPATGHQHKARGETMQQASPFTVASHRDSSALIMVAIDHLN